MKQLSRVRLLTTPSTVARQAPPSMGFSRQEYWSGLPCPSPGDLPGKSGPLIKPDFMVELQAGGASGKEFTCQCRRCKRHRFSPCREDTGAGNCNRLQHSCLENPMDVGILVGYQRSSGLQRVRQDWAHTHTGRFPISFRSHERTSSLLEGCLHRRLTLNRKWWLLPLQFTHVVERHCYSENKYRI